MQKKISLIACLAISLVACRRQPPASVIPVPTAEDSGAADSARAAREAAEREETQRAAAAAERERLEREERASAERALLAPVHFEFDRSDLTQEARANLDAKLALLRANPRLRIRVEGHADDRGSSEYNVALGMRRAAAVRRYFVQRDISDDRIDTASFGEERPICEVAEEPCWGINRRAEFAIIAR